MGGYLHEREKTCSAAAVLRRPARAGTGKSGKILESFYNRLRNPYEMSYEEEDEEELLAYTVSEGTTCIADGAFRRVRPRAGAGQRGQ